MKRKMKSWISLLLCLMMVLQSVTAVAAEPEEGTQQPLTKAELTLTVKDAEHGTVTVIEKVKQADELYYFQPEEEVKVQITPEEGYELKKLVMKGLDTQKELLPETKDGYYLWKAEENMELEATFVEVPKEPEVTPEEPEVKPEEPEVKPEQPEVKPEEPEVKPEEPEEEPETEATPEEPEVTPEEVTLTDDPMGELLSIQPNEKNEPVTGKTVNAAAQSDLEGTGEAQGAVPPDETSGAGQEEQQMSADEEGSRTPPDMQNETSGTPEEMETTDIPEASGYSEDSSSLAEAVEAMEGFNSAAMDDLNGLDPLSGNRGLDNGMDRMNRMDEELSTQREKSFDSGLRSRDVKHEGNLFRSEWKDALNKPTKSSESKSDLEARW